MDSRSYQDHFFKKAKISGYRSRSAFKLIELNSKFKFLKNGIKLLDAGSFPGGWSQVAAEKIKNGKILSIDLKEMDKIKNIFQIKGDFSEEKYKNQIKEYFKENVDIVLSDMAVNTTGNKNLDSIVTGELCIEALNFAIDVLKKNGQFVSKIFMGSTFNEIVTIAKKNFIKTYIFKPPASRKESKESFIICKFLRDEVKK